MDEVNFTLVDEGAECLHFSATISGPKGTKSYGLPTDYEKCLECGWRAFEQACGKKKDLPAVQIVWWPHSESTDGPWVAECFEFDPAPGQSSLLGRGQTAGAAVFKLAREITSYLKDQPQ